MEPAGAPQARARTVKQAQKNAAQAKGGAAADASAPKSYVPPPPPDGAKIAPPAGMPAVKMFPISTGPPPAGMSFPGVEAAQPQETGGGGAATEGQDAAPVEEIDDGFTPEQRRKNNLENDAGFKKYLMMYRMKIPLINIRNKIEAESDGTYAKGDIDLFAAQLEIEEADASLIKTI